MIQQYLLTTTQRQEKTHVRVLTLQTPPLKTVTYKYVNKHHITLQLHVTQQTCNNANYSLTVLC